ncbi:DUF4363 family protein [Clostridium tarantellae]|uniref:DUF4363 family protein n=1 Tax=Clostridium tarantellae TaxID=39493 RepID=A0A6I1MMX2_9CLOT|nr:DUF4363 family protein [Clostridium tarantellae]MPQ44735.1 DUF4363 family protein [Clostridium tarantellae]
MKNTIISFFIFFMVFAFVTIYNNKLTTFCNNVLNTSNELEELLCKENWQKSYEKTLELKKLMSKGFKDISIYINHENVDNLNTEVLKLTQFVKVKSNGDALSTIHAIKCFAEYLKELEEINLINIF